MIGRTTNALLAAILLAQVSQIYLSLENTAEAETFQLDYCITQSIYDKPTQYVHVVSHSLEKDKDEQDY